MTVSLTLSVNLTLSFILISYPLAKIKPLNHNILQAFFCQLKWR